MAEKHLSITDELREWAQGDTLRAGMSLRTARDQAIAIADRIDEQHAKARDEAYNEGVNDGIDADKNATGYIKGPVDADGVPWHLGDKVDGMVGSITYLTLGYIGWKFQLGDPYTFQCENYRHYHEPTVEDVLREFALACEDAGNAGPEVERIAAEYAAKLRLAGEVE